MDISRIKEYSSPLTVRSPVAAGEKTVGPQSQDWNSKASDSVTVINEESVRGLSEGNTSTKKPDAGIEDIVLSFKSRDAEAAGRSSDIKSLDVQKAISDMKKDQVLQQYQYFVGGSRNTGGQADGVVITKF